MTYTIRKLHRTEYRLLKHFLYEAIFLPEGVEPAPYEIVDDPAMRIYYENFGSHHLDIALCAEIESEADKRVAGVIWCRCIHGFGHIEENVPELALAVRKPYRGLGIGSKLIDAILGELQMNRGCKGVSLAVQKKNFAHHIYIKKGFRVVDENADEYIMYMEI